MTPFLLSLQNIDLLVVGIAVAGMVVLGFAVLFNNFKSISNRTFFCVAITAGIWGFINYLSHQQYSIELSFFLLRLVMFFAVWASFFTFTFAYIFPLDSAKFPPYYKWVILPSTIVTAILTLTPLVFSRIAEFVDGRIFRVDNGPGIFIFGIVATCLNLGSVISLVQKAVNSNQTQKGPIRIVLFGIVCMLFLIITFNFVLPAFLGNTSFIPFGALFLFPFIVFTFYAIVKYQFLNIKVITTEVLTFILAVVTLLEVVLSRELGVLIFRISTFALVLSFGILLIRSVRKEIEQREQLQVLTKELEVANTELKRLDKAKSEFVSIASHQLRTPLTAVKGYVSMLLEGSYGKITKKMHRPIANVYESNERLINLVNDLLSLSRIESGKMVMEWSDTRIDEIAQSVVDELQIKAKQKNIRLFFQKPEEALPLIRIDKDKIRNVILNLVDNAIRYTKKGSIKVGIGKIGERLRVNVTDTGEGMAKEEIGKLFESFSRGQAGMKLSTEGTGLGLYIARQFVHMHKGKIWAESEGKGRGSTFFVELSLLS